MNEKRTVRVRMKRLSPGFVFRMVCGSKSGVGSCDSAEHFDVWVCGMSSCEGFDADSKISAIAAPNQVLTSNWLHFSASIS